MKTVYIVYPDSPGTIAPEIYGHFSEHIGGVFYDGLWVGHNSLVENIGGFRKALIDKFREIAPPVLRWPGGCFAETYDWRDGIGKERPVRRNWWTPWDGRLESNEVGTHEFMELCSLLGTKPYFAANVTSVTPLHIAQWMDYCLSPENTTTLSRERAANGSVQPFQIPYWGVGNENWGGGGNMTPAYYASEFRKYAEVMRDMSRDVTLVACGPNAADYRWTEVLLENIRDTDFTGGLSMHYYCGSAGDPLTFTQEEWYTMLRQADRMDEILNRHWSFVKSAGLEKRLKLVIDEWGCWHPDGSGPSRGYNLFEQQSTIRDAAVAALTLNIFNNNCDKIMMANVAQLVNNLHCLFLAAGEKFTVTPTYHVFHMYKDHQGAQAARCTVSGNEEFESSVSVSASKKDGRTLITLLNLSASQDTQVLLQPVGGEFTGGAVLTVLSNDDLHAHNTFESPDSVKPHSEQIDLSKPFTLPRGGIAAIQTELH